MSVIAEWILGGDGCAVGAGVVAVAEDCGEGEGPPCADAGIGSITVDATKTAMSADKACTLFWTIISLTFAKILD